MINGIDRARRSGIALSRTPTIDACDTSLIESQYDQSRQQNHSRTTLIDAAG
jgi:hypothetical protein